MSTQTRRLTALAALVTAGVTALSGCSLISMIPGVPHATTDGTVAFTYDGKQVPTSAIKVVCMFDGKGNVAFLSADENTGDTFVGAYSAEGEHANVLKTAEFPLSLIASNSSGDTDIAKATVDGQTYTFEGVIKNLSEAMASNSSTDVKRPYKAVVTCK